MSSLMIKELGSGNWEFLRDRLIRALGLGSLACAVLTGSGCMKSQTRIGSESLLINKSTNKSSKSAADPYPFLNTTGETAVSGSHSENAVVPPADFSKKKTESTNTEILEDQFPEIADGLKDVKLDPDNPQKHLRLGQLYHRVRVYDRALEEYELASALDPDNPIYYETIGRLLRDAGEYQRGIEPTLKALKLDPNSLDSWNTLGTIYDRMGERGKAQQAYSQALSINPDLDFVHNNLCSSFLQVGEYSRALPYCEQAVTLNPTLSAAQNNLGITQGMLGNTLEAYEAFRKAGDEASAHNNLGWVLLQKGNLEMAGEQFKLAARLKPNYRLAGQNYNLTKNMIFMRDRRARNHNTLGTETSLCDQSSDPTEGYSAIGVIPDLPIALNLLPTALDFAVEVSGLFVGQDGLKIEEISSDMSNRFVGEDDILKRHSILKRN
ncbi:MAG: tetratricopeptide repeat protein [Terriglobia bacterium]